jgi:hypothetical protein
MTGPKIPLQEKKRKSSVFDMRLRTVGGGGGWDTLPPHVHISQNAFHPVPGIDRNACKGFIPLTKKKGAITGILYYSFRWKTQLAGDLNFLQIILINSTKRGKESRIASHGERLIS